MELSGIVKNVVDFGAFVDLGCGADGLLHVSKYPPRGSGVEREKVVTVGARSLFRVAALDIQDLKQKKVRIQLECANTAAAAASAFIK